MALFDNLTIFILLTLGSYLLGSISFGLIISRILNLGDLRSIGSGNTGATNVLRTGNKKAALFTLLLDAGKGALVVYLGISFFDSFTVNFMALAVFIGHLFPVWQKFKGGKGVATLFGIALVISFSAGLLTCLTWLLVAVVFRKSSLSALLGALFIPVWLWVFNEPDFIVLFTLLNVFVFIKHRENIKRLIDGTETNISFVRRS
ncbi:MAG: glycerol-3-phosphate 1-O-acyltransferase PlsY [Paracoccaceae bacterium]|nr:glycerol-3-phosphate 1-O-acyltransferase PlsY [Paracoccaceae bacterium]